MRYRTLCVFGTRPEAIKMAPVIQALNQHNRLENQVCITGQHRDMMTPVLTLFGIKPDYDLHVMRANQRLSELTANILTGLDQVFDTSKPDVVLVHGDTTTTLATALAAYYHRIPIAHVEAGLRTGNLFSPWPEEANRKLTGSLANLHFAPTEAARDHLLREGVSAETIFVTGNTVIDALQRVSAQLDRDPTFQLAMSKQFPFLSPKRRMLLVTGHRRENFGQGFINLCQALAHLAHEFPLVDIVYPVHLNPNVQQPVKKHLDGIGNIHLIEPQEYTTFIYLMKQAHVILTDSGGVQEEAPSLGKPVLLTRDTSERPEAITAGTVLMVGTNVAKIIATVTELLQNPALYQRMSQIANPYGDGLAASRIATIVAEKLAITQEVAETV